MKSNTLNTKSGMDLKCSHRSRAILRKLPKMASILSSVLIGLSVIISLPTVFADQTNTTFQVNVVDSLSVEVTTPTSGASGNMNEFLRNKVSLSVTTNNANGFTASMTTKTASTNLVNTVQNTYTLPTLGSNNVVRSSFPANYWGYSLDDTEAGDNSSHYSAMVGLGSTPITILSSNTAASASKDFYFGAKGNASLASGTYTGTVVISVVTDVTDNNTNPITPTDPVKPSDDTPNDNVATYQSSPRNRTIYTTTSSDTTNNTETTTTEITSGDNTASYTPPQGVTENVVSRISSGSDLATGLGITASVAAATGAFFFIIAGRDEGDEEEEEDRQPQ